MTNDQALAIRIKILEREYPMVAKPEMESIIRQAGKIINDRLQSYKQELGIDDRQDLLAMIAIDCMVNLLTHEKEKTLLNNLLHNTLSHWDDLIVQALQVD